MLHILVFTVKLSCGLVPDCENWVHFSVVMICESSLRTITLSFWTYFHGKSLKMYFFNGSFFFLVGTLKKLFKKTKNYIILQLIFYLFFLNKVTSENCIIISWFNFLFFFCFYAFLWLGFRRLVLDPFVWNYSIKTWPFHQNVWLTWFSFPQFIWKHYEILFLNLKKIKKETKHHKIIKFVCFHSEKN